MSTEAKSTAVALPDKQKELAEKLNSNVLAVIGSEKLNGFEKAFLIATATQELKKLLTSEYMKPIMALQGSKLGFKTDKDDKGGYPEEVVKNCLIEAVLTGVMPYGNQFNIIASNMYVTKEGFGYLLVNFNGLKYEIIPALPRINADKTSAAVLVKIRYTINGESKETDLDIPVKMNAFMGVDACLGKATRKARAWLFNTISGRPEVADGDAVDINAEVVSSRVETKEQKASDVATAVKNMIGPKKDAPKEDASKLTPEEKAEYTPKVNKDGQASLM